MEADEITVRIGNKTLGHDYPVLIQSMCNVPTLDTNACVDQCIRIFEAGAGLSRITARNVKEAKNLHSIRQQLTDKGYDQPLCADVHFNPAIALEAAKSVEKVRINPGNFASGDIETPFLEFLEICRKHNTAIRIGVNHGSLSERILEKYGDTPEGMVESALEYLRICRRENFKNAVVSVKSSNTRIMVYSNRLMKQSMERENLVFPIHLGVTEAGEGDDGRIRSAAGIGTLLGEEIGETIRVSLTEEPEFEIPVAEILLEASDGMRGKIKQVTRTGFTRRESVKTGLIGGGQTPVVIARMNGKNSETNSSVPGASDSSKNGVIIPGPGLTDPDYYFISDHVMIGGMSGQKRCILNAEAWLLDDYPEGRYFPLFDLKGFLSSEKTSGIMNFILIQPDQVTEARTKLKQITIPCCLIYLHHSGSQYREAFLELAEDPDIRIPVIIQATYNDHDEEMFKIRAASELSWYFIDGYADGLWMDRPFKDQAVPMTIAFKILQASRARMTETEYIACPSCGRTLFNIQDTLDEVKKATSHLKHLKIAVMGCIVNGPGEMADADYGYVGSGKGKISLYRQKEIIKKNIKEEDAVMELLDLIKKHGDWID